MHRILFFEIGLAPNALSVESLQYYEETKSTGVVPGIPDCLKIFKKVDMQEVLLDKSLIRSTLYNGQL